VDIDIQEPLICDSGFGPHQAEDECSVCLGEHQEETHNATLRVRAWFRGRVTRYLDCEQLS
jgi:hypothetical protein